jgi:glycosyltransferase involved in cell wall biosynthesis
MTAPHPPTAKVLRILGTRGVPAAHGGFETFAEQLAPYLVQRGWQVVVYCQEFGSGVVHTDRWQGVDRVHIPVATPGAAGTIVFDWHATRHAARHGGLCLTLGYNTAVFCALLRLARVRNVINMDGIEWARAKWGPVAKAWFWLNDHAGCHLGNHLVADHPEIARHLRTRVGADRITVIPYGADDVQDADADEGELARLGLERDRFLTVIARPEPENSLLEIVEGFSASPRPYTLVVLGQYDDTNDYHRRVRAAAGPGVRFLGAIYDKVVVQALRRYSLAYVHGHQVGGTNPSLVEALGAGNAVIAHDNRFNRWVAGEGARYFGDAASLARVLDELQQRPAEIAAMRAASRARFLDGLQWPQVLGQYEAMLEKWV